MIDEGYIKFKCDYYESEKFWFKDFDTINYYRTILYIEKLIGIYDNKICYGNISIRMTDSDEFIITGTQTGQYDVLSSNQYANVFNYNLSENQISCYGPIKASSESLSHAVIYTNMPSIGSVIHIHSLELWNELIDKVPTTNKEAEFGTVEIAQDIIRLIKETDFPQKKILVMGGHQEGIITIGKTIKEAFNVLYKYIK